MAVINLSYDPEAKKEAASGVGPLLPEGGYVLRLQSFENQAPTREGGAPVLVCKCTVVQSFNQQNLNRTITRRFFLSQKAIPYRFEPFLKAAGIPYQDNGAGIQFDSDHLLGATTRVTCRHKPAQDQSGRMFEEWENDEPMGGAPQTFHQPPQFAPPGFPQAGPPPGAQAPGQPQWGPPMQAPPQQPPPQQWGPPPQQQGFAPPAAQPPQQWGAPPTAAPSNGSAPPWQTR